MASSQPPPSPRQEEEEEEEDQTHIRQERAQRALHVAAISGFITDNGRLQESCLRLCNTCREFVPLKKLKLEYHSPRIAVAILVPPSDDRELQNAAGASGGSSRVGAPFQRAPSPDKEGERTSTADVLEKAPANEETLSAVTRRPLFRVLPIRRVLAVDWGFMPWARSRECDDYSSHSRADENYGEDYGEDYDEDFDDNGKSRDGTDVNINHVCWPEGIKEITLCAFNQVLDFVTWPETLQRLSFERPNIFRGSSSSPRGRYSQSLDCVYFPAGLREIVLGDRFDEPIKGVTWPAGLRRLSMSGFNHPIEGVQWPTELRSLEFTTSTCIENHERAAKFPGAHAHPSVAGRFNYPLGYSLPQGLEALWLSDAFNQSLEGVVWPSGLQTVRVGDGYLGVPMSGVHWPASLCRLFFVYEPWETRGDVPEWCQVFSLHNDEDSDSGSLELSAWDGPDLRDLLGEYGGIHELEDGPGYPYHDVDGSISDSDYSM